MDYQNECIVGLVVTIVSAIFRAIEKNRLRKKGLLKDSEQSETK